MNLWVTTTDYDWKYKGLFVTAVDGEGRYVGNWEFPGETQHMFWSPPECGSTHLIQKDANLKPLRIQLFFRAPEEGTGTISFRALIKRGDPNTGGFYYPNVDGQLTLEEADLSSDPIAPKLLLAPKGASCTGFCSTKDADCDAAVLRDAAGDTASGLMRLLAPTDATRQTQEHQVVSTVLCRPPALQACSAVAPAVKASTAECWFYRKDDTCAVIANGVAVDNLATVEGCDDLDGSDDRAVCDAVPLDGEVQRLCACTARRRRRSSKRSAAGADEAAHNSSSTPSTHIRGLHWLILGTGLLVSISMSAADTAAPPRVERRKQCHCRQR